MNGVITDEARLVVHPEGADRVVTHSDPMREVQLVRPAALPHTELYALRLRGAAQRPDFRYRNAFTVVLCDQTDVELSYAGGQYRCKSGAASVSRPYEGPRVVRAHSEETRCRVVSIASTTVETLLGSSAGRLHSELLPGWAIAATPRLADATRALFLSLRESSVLAQHAALLGCVQAVSELYEGALPRASNVPISVRRARDYLHEHYYEDVANEVLAEAVGDLHPRYLLSLFTRTMNLPPHQYVLRLRVDRAREMIASGATASHAATVVGFCDQSQLHRHFVRFVGVTPGAYARACR